LLSDLPPDAQNAAYKAGMADDDGVSFFSSIHV
jgi:hypothetical protein